MQWGSYMFYTTNHIVASLIDKVCWLLTYLLMCESCRHMIPIEL